MCIRDRFEAGRPLHYSAPLCTDVGHFLGRPDLYYPTHRLAVEYDGVGHRERMSADNQRQNRLVDAGYRLLRFTVFDVLSTRHSMVTLVGRALDLNVRTSSGHLPKR